MIELATFLPAGDPPLSPLRESRGAVGIRFRPDGKLHSLRIGQEFCLHRHCLVSGTDRARKDFAHFAETIPRIAATYARFGPTQSVAMEPLGGCVHRECHDLYGRMGRLDRVAEALEERQRLAERTSELQRLGHLLELDESQFTADLGRLLEIQR